MIYILRTPEASPPFSSAARAKEYVIAYLGPGAYTLETWMLDHPAEGPVCEIFIVPPREEGSP